RRQPVTDLAERRGQSPPGVQHYDPWSRGCLGCPSWRGCGGAIRGRQIAWRRCSVGVELNHLPGHALLLSAQSPLRASRSCNGCASCSVFQGTRPFFHLLILMEKTVRIGPHSQPEEHFGAEEQLRMRTALPLSER